MATSTFALPLDKSKIEKAKEFIQHHQGPRKEHFKEMTERHGLQKVQVWLQEEPPVVIVQLTGPDIGKAHMSHSESDHEFDVWMKDMMKELHGMEFHGISSSDHPQAKLVVDHSS
jgi:dsRNA-specific ribonuclease